MTEQIIIYVIITIIIFALMHIFEVDNEDLIEYVGNWGKWLFVVIFFIPLVIHSGWLNNWDCNLNTPQTRKIK